MREVEREYDLWADDRAPLLARSATADDYVDLAYLGIDAESVDHFKAALADLAAATAGRLARNLASTCNRFVRAADAIALPVSFRQWRTLDQALRHFARRLPAPRSAGDVLVLPRALVRTHADAARAARRDPSSLFTMAPRAFEETIAGLLHLKGFDVNVTPASRDRGFDIIAVSHVLDVPFKWIVECKRYSRSLVTAPVVQQLFGAAAGEGADRVLLVTTSGFTRDAQEFAARNPTLHLWGRPELLRHVASAAA